MATNLMPNKTGSATPTPITNIYKFASSDFLTSTPFPDTWVAGAINSGTFSNINCVAPTINHPGVGGIFSSTTPDSGYKIVGYASPGLLLGGGEESNFIFSLPSVVTAGTTSRLGFQDSITVTDPVDGVYISIVDTTLKGRCLSNSSATATGTTYTLVAGTWYRTNIELNANATLATFQLYDSATGVLLWTDTVASNIPTGAGRFTGHGVVSTNSGTVAVQLITLDYMDISINRILVR